MLCPCNIKISLNTKGHEILATVLKTERIKKINKIDY